MTSRNTLAAPATSAAPEAPATFANPLPHRKVLQGVLAKNASYGLAIFARDKRCAVVRRRYTFAYYDFLRGTYREAYFGGILRSLTIGELGLVRRMAGCAPGPPQPDLRLLRSEGERVIYRYSEEDFDQARAMLLICRAKVAGYDPAAGGNLTEEWTLPKGHLKELESGVGCAVRECREELGLEVPPALVRDADFVEVHNSMTNGVTYISHYWPLVLPEALQPPAIEAKGAEVCGRAWKTLDELATCMRGYNLAVIGEMARGCGLLPN